MKRVNTTTITRFKHGKESIEEIKKQYGDLLYYIALRGLGNREDALRCLEKIYDQLGIKVTENKSKHMNYITWLLLHTKDSVDTFRKYSVKRVKKVRLDNGLLIEVPYIENYTFDYFNEVGYSLLQEEEFLVFYLIEKYRIKESVIAKLLDLSVFTIKCLNQSGREKVGKTEFLK